MLCPSAPFCCKTSLEILGYHIYRIFYCPRIYLKCPNLLKYINRWNYAVIFTAFKQNAMIKSFNLPVSNPNLSQTHQNVKYANAMKQIKIEISHITHLYEEPVTINMIIHLVPFYWHSLTLIRAGICNDIHHKVLDKIICPFPNFKGWGSLLLHR